MSDTPKEKTAKETVPWFTLRNEAREIPQDIAYELAAIVIQWGSFENALYIDLEQLRKYPNVTALSETIPLNFKKRIELWKRSVLTLFPEVSLYKNTAAEICIKGKQVAVHRHRLIHGHWSPDMEDGKFVVLSGRDRPKEMVSFYVDLNYAKSIHVDINTMANAVYSFMINRMMHAHEGLLTAHPVPSSDHPALKTQPKPDKP